MSNLTGLIANNSETIPLKNVHVIGEIVGYSTKICLSQTFQNTEDKPVEAIYKFPLPEGAAICGFNIDVDGKNIRGKVEEREEAFDQYDNAISRGYGAYLMDEERPNIFTLSVGNLKPDSIAKINIEYVTMLDGDKNSVRFFLPTTISPRYVPGNLSEKERANEYNSLHPEYALETPYGLQIDLNIYGTELIN